LHRLLHKLGFVLRFKTLSIVFDHIRHFWFSLLGMQIGKGTRLPKLSISWPHQVALGKNCKLEPNINFKYDGPWLPGPRIVIGDTVFIGANCEFNINEGIKIGNDSLIASGCKFIDHDHGISTEKLMHSQVGSQIPIKVGNDVWLGCNVVVLKGAVIGDGSIVAAGAVVTKPIPAYEIWAGIPAKKIGERK